MEASNKHQYLNIYKLVEYLREGYSEIINNTRNYEREHVLINIVQEHRN